MNGERVSFQPPLTASLSPSSQPSASPAPWTGPSWWSEPWPRVPTVKEKDGVECEEERRGGEGVALLSSPPGEGARSLPQPLLLFFSLFCPGAFMPAFSIVLGRVMDTVGDPASGGLPALDKAALWFLYLGAAAGVAALCEAAAWGCAGVRAGRAARVHFLEAALAKPMAFHEGVASGAGDLLPAKSGGGSKAVVAVTASAATLATAATAPAPAAATAAASAAPATVSVCLMRALEDDAEAVRRTLAVDCGPFVNQVAKVVAGLAVGALRNE